MKKTIKLINGSFLGAELDLPLDVPDKDLWLATFSKRYNFFLKRGIHYNEFKFSDRLSQGDPIMGGVAGNEKDRVYWTITGIEKNQFTVEKGINRILSQDGLKRKE